MAHKSRRSRTGQRDPNADLSTRGLSVAITPASEYVRQLQDLKARQEQAESFLRQRNNNDAIKKQSSFTNIQDKRRYHPAGKRQSLLTRHATISKGITIGDPRSKRYKRYKAQTKGLQTFVNPRNLIICIKRKIRKQIMFALQLRPKGGRGGSRKREKRRYDENSKIRC